MHVVSSLVGGEQMVDEYKLQVESLGDIINIEVASGQAVRSNKRVRATVRIDDHEDLVFIVAPIKHDVVLGVNWLGKYHGKVDVKCAQPVDVKVKDDSGNSNMLLPICCQTRKSIRVFKVDPHICSLKQLNSYIEKNEKVEMYWIHINMLSDDATIMSRISSRVQEVDMGARLDNQQ